MKVKIESSRFGEAAKVAAKIVNAKDATDPFAFMTVSAHDGKLTVVGANGSCSVSVSSPCEVHEEGECSLYAKNLAAFATSLPVGETEIVCKESGTRADIKCGKTRFTIAAHPFERHEFEIGDTVANFSVSAVVLRELIRKAMPAISHDDTRRTLMGVLVEGKNGHVRFVATDGRRLHLAEVDLEIPSDFSFVLREDAAKTILGVLSDEDEVKIVSGKNGIEFSGDGWTVRAAIPADVYPNYSRVFPDESQLTTNVVFDRDEMKAALMRANLANDGESNPVTITIGEAGIKIDSRTGDTCSCDGEIASKVNGPGLKILINSKLILDALSVIEEGDVNVFTAPGQAFLVKCQVPFVAVIMPLRF